MRGGIAKFRRSTKGLSAIFAVLLIIAIAVIAGIILYMFTSGYISTMMGGGTAGQEKVAIETVQTTLTGVTVWAKSTGGGPVEITEVILRDAAGNTVTVDEAPTGDVVLPADGTIGDISATFALTSGQVYTVALVSSQGNQFVSQSFKGA